MRPRVIALRGRWVGGRAAHSQEHSQAEHPDTPKQEDQKANHAEDHLSGGEHVERSFTLSPSPRPRIVDQRVRFC